MRSVIGPILTVERVWSIQRVEGIVGRRVRTCRWATRISLLRSRFSSKKGVKHTSQIGKFVQVPLLLADVPVQALSQRIEPVGDLVLGANGRHRVDGCRNPQTRRGESEKHKLERKTTKFGRAIWASFLCFLVVCRVEVGLKRVEGSKMGEAKARERYKWWVIAQTYLRHSTLGDVSRRMRPRPCCEHRGGASPAAVGSNSSLLLTKREPHLAPQRATTHTKTNETHNTRTKEKKNTHAYANTVSAHNHATRRAQTTTSQQQQRPGLTLVVPSMSKHSQSIMDMIWTQFHQAFF